MVGDFKEAKVYVERAHEVEMHVRANVLYTIRVFLKLLIRTAHYAWVVAYWSQFFVIRYLSYLLHDMLIKGFFYYTVGGVLWRTTQSTTSLYETLLFVTVVYLLVMHIYDRYTKHRHYMVARRQRYM